MIVPGSANSLLLAQGAATGYNLTKSLRFRQSASAYLNRTFTTPTSTQKGTISFWCKRSKLGSGGTIITLYGQVNTSLGSGPYIQFSNDAVRFYDNNTDLYSTALFRDPAAWYHIVVAIDTTQATSTNRVKIYVNGSQLTSFDTPTYGAQNYASDILASGSQYIGYSQPLSNRGADHYMAEVNFIDGQQLTPSSFGENNAVTGVWQPKKYTGTYGTNGFYLPFTDTTSTTTLGYDSSGNGNNWTVNNISLTAGSTYDSMTDVPTLTSATTANYCVLNPLVASGATISSANLYFAQSSSPAGGPAIIGTLGVSTGKWYFESTINSIASGADQLYGIGDVTKVASSPYPGSSGTNSFGAYNYPGSAYIMSAYNASFTNTDLTSTSTSGDVIQIAFDMDAGKFWIGKNNTWANSGNPATGTNPTLTGITGTQIPCFRGSGNANASSAYVNFGQQGFKYTPPTGYVALNTYNLSAPTIAAGNKYMDATLWTGDAVTPKTVYSNLQFQPDMVWAKTRSTATQHALYDSVRGAGSGHILIPNTTDPEGGTAGSTSDAQYGYLSSFNSNGISTVTGSSGTNYFFNNNGVTYVAWNWKAGQGTTSTNTNGSITSTVSVNASAGFSIVTYTGTGSAATIGHGLGVAPTFMIVKCRSSTLGWLVYHSSIGATNYLTLNTTNASASASSIWNNTAPTSSVLSIGTDAGVNTNTATYVAYCWAQIAGFSAFGSYTGNGSTDGPFIYTGFRPKYVMIKRTDSTGNWICLDTSRSAYNYQTNTLEANLSDAEYSSSGGWGWDFLSNGFKLRDNGLQDNTSNGNYIYMAFAENPFKYALAR